MSIECLQAAGLLHPDQAGSESADPDDDLGGILPGSARSIPFAGLFNTLMGTLLVASGTATLNQWMEIPWDARMRRTANRPLAFGKDSALVKPLFSALS